SEEMASDLLEIGHTDPKIPSIPDVYFTTFKTTFFRRLKIAVASNDCIPLLSSGFNHDGVLGPAPFLLPVFPEKPENESHIHSV
ncbi:hypothetical protein N9189_02540, partial [Pirellulaceae bacterium]|nr:hypothetical protein [Pirellulaceae bacterium]